MKCSSFNRFFEVLGNKTRIKIINSLMERPKCVSDIQDDIKEEQSKISHNLKVLSNCHIVNSKRDGKNIIYSLNEDTIVPIINIVNEHVKKHCKKNCEMKR